MAAGASAAVVAATPSLLDVSSPAALIAQLTRACDAYEATGARDAETYLLAFQSLPQPFDFTRYALQHASSARLLHLSLSAHVAAVVRHWRLLGATDRRRETDVLLWFVTERAASQQPFVLSQSVHAAAVLLKRHWLDGGGEAEWAHARLQHTLDRLTAAAASLPPVRVAVELVHDMVSEMALSARSSLPLGVTAASVVAAHSSFERVALLTLFTRLAQLMRALLPSVPNSADSGDVLLRCVRAVEQCLLWHFHVDRDAALRYLSSAASSVTEAATLTARLQPPVAWRPVLLEHDLLSMLVACDRQLLSARRCTLDVMLCLAPLAALTGPVFTQPSDKERFIDSLIHHTCHLLDLHLQYHQQQQHHAGALDGKLLSAVHSTLSGAMISLSLARLLSLPSLAAWLSCLSHLTRCLLQHDSFAHASFTSGTDTALAEALHAALATWAELAMAVAEEREADRQPSNSGAALGLIEQQGSELFSLYLVLRLKREAGGQDTTPDRECDDEEQFAGADNEQEHLVSVAFLARLQPASSLRQYQPLLAHFIQLYSTGLSSNHHTADSASCCERLLLLVDLLSCILTDSAEGEASAIPSMLLSGLRGTSVVDSLVDSVVSVLALLVAVVRAGQCSRLSPALAVSVLGMLRRTAGVYVDVDPGESLYANPSAARELLLSPACLARVTAVQFDAASAFLSLWAGEEEVHNAALRSLFPLIVQHRSRPVAVSSGGYSELCQLLHSSAAPSPSADVQLSAVDSLSSATQSLLVAVLSRSCADASALGALWSPIQSRLSCVVHQIAQQGAAGWLSDPRNVVYCASSVALLCGVSESTSAASFDAAFALLSARWADLTRVLRAAVAVPPAAPIVTATLSLLVSSAEQQLSYTDTAQSSRFMALCAEAVRLYLHAMQQRVAALSAQQAGKAGRAEAELLADSYEEDATLLLRLLNELCSDDTWSAGLDSVERAGELCVMAVSTLLSDALFMQLLSASAASSSASSSSSSSSLVSLFFALLHDACTTHPARVAALPSAVRARLIAVLLHAPQSVARQCLKGVAAIAAHCAKQPPAQSAASLEGDVCRILHWLFTSLIARPLPAALLEPVSDTLLACCVAVPQRIGELATAAISDWQQQQRSTQQDDSGYEAAAAELSALRSSLAALVSSNGLRAELSMDNKRKMRANVLHFINAVNTERGGAGT